MVCGQIFTANRKRKCTSEDALEKHLERMVCADELDLATATRHRGRSE